MGTHHFWRGRPPTNELGFMINMGSKLPFCSWTDVPTSLPPKNNNKENHLAGCLGVAKVCVAKRAGTLQPREKGGLAHKTKQQRSPSEGHPAKLRSFFPCSPRGATSLRLISAHAELNISAQKQDGFSTSILIGKLRARECHAQFR